jgi:hypothetical protein
MIIMKIKIEDKKRNNNQVGHKKQQLRYKISQ